MKLKLYFFYFLLFFNIGVFGQNVFFNEIDHLNPDLCVEIAAAPGEDLTGWFVTTYDENGIALDTISLTGVSPTSVTSHGYNIIEVDIVMLTPTNGGVSLIDNTNTLVQFLSYAGSITAVDGPAAGQTSENIGTQTASGNALQLQGTGSGYGDFDWGIPGDNTCGFENDGQTLLAPESPLAVELLYFEGLMIDENIELSWATSSEQNNLCFAIEKSHNGIDFSEVAKIPGAINSPSINTYRYLDESSMFFEVYYRLAFIDLDTNIKYSEVIVFTFKSLEDQVLIFPNPVNQQLNITIPKLPGTTQIILYNLTGEMILHKTLIDSDESLISLNLTELSEGAYFLHIDNTAFQYQEKVLKGF